MIEAFFFGPCGQQIFATYHPPLGGNGQVLTVICPPFFNEYMRTHLALRELAISLAERGQHVLRFDYRGTGDSFGELREVSLVDWQEDITLAVREGREISGSSRVYLLGVRAASLLACSAVDLSSDVQRVVLWDPVLDGSSYLQSLRDIQMVIADRQLWLSRAERRRVKHEYAGYVLSEAMEKQLVSFDASAYLSVPDGLLRVVSSSTTSFPIQRVPHTVALFNCEWNTAAEELILARPVLERLVECLTNPS